jgi:hypothetical protein
MESIDWICTLGCLGLCCGLSGLATGMAIGFLEMLVSLLLDSKSSFLFV